MSEIISSFSQITVFRRGFYTVRLDRTTDSYSIVAGLTDKLLVQIRSLARKFGIAALVRGDLRGF